MTLSYHVRAGIGVCGAVVIMLGFFLPWFVASAITYTGWLFLSILIPVGYAPGYGGGIVFAFVAAFILLFALLALGSGIAAFFQKRPWPGGLYQRLGVVGLITVLVLWLLGRFLVAGAGL